MNPATQNEPTAVLTKRRHLVGVWKNLPSEKAVVLFADATANRDDLADLLGRPVVDVTPSGLIRWRGRSESGREVIVEGRGYDHPRWERAHRSLVRAAIVQAAERCSTPVATSQSSQPRNAAFPSPTMPTSN